ncbi:MAG: serine hydrolase, partial [Bacteroidetes bacterium]|nr:serine hydrolase [Bacteroidota bacterium]
DYTNWIKLLLAEGIFKTDTIFSKKVIHQMWSANTPLNVSQGSTKLWPSTHLKAYGLGWGLSDYMGRKIVTHGGGTDGMTCYTALIPEEELGIIILTNKYSGMYYPLTYQTLDAFLAPPDHSSDWSTTLLDITNSRKEHEKAEKEKAEKELITGTRPSLSVEKYTGTYGGKLYGNCEVRVAGDDLFITMIPAPKLTSKLTHLYYDTYSIKFGQFPGLPSGT